MYGTYSPPQTTFAGQSDHTKMFQRARSSGRPIPSFQREIALPCFVPRSTPIAIPTSKLSFHDQQAKLSEYNKQYKQQRAQRRGSDSDGVSHNYKGHECNSECDLYCELSLGSACSTGDDEPDSWLDCPQAESRPEPYAISRSIDFDWTS